MSPSASPAVRRQQMIAKLGYLTESDVFSGKAAGTEDLSQVGSVQRFVKGDVFFSPRDHQERLILLREGQVQVFRVDAEGNQISITILEPGALFGKMTLLGQGMHHVSAVAATDGAATMIERADLERLFVENPQLALRVLNTLGQRLIEAEARLEDIAFKSIPARLASLLLRLSDNGADQISGYTHQELAEMIGTYRETTTQTLNHFKSQGLLSIGRKRIQIRDRDALARIAE